MPDETMEPILIELDADQIEKLDADAAMMRRNRQQQAEVYVLEGLHLWPPKGAAKPATVLKSPVKKSTSPNHHPPVPVEG